MLNKNIKFKPSEYKKKNKLAIVGFAPTWNKTPFEDEDFEVWALNELYMYFNQVKSAHAERWFEIHSPNSPSKNTPQHRAWLRKATIPIYMQKHFDDIPMSTPYPKEEIFKWFEENGYYGAKYFTNSISWMIALAIMEGYEEIQILGVDMAQDSEYGFQRPSCEYFIGIAEGLGIKIYIPAESDLLKAGILYGYESDNTMRLRIKGRIKELEGRKKQLSMELQQAQAVINKCNTALLEINGALSDSAYWLRNWS